jgi:hypothetical protein
MACLIVRDSKIAATAQRLTERDRVFLGHEQPLSVFFSHSGKLLFKVIEKLDPFRQ